MQLEQNTIVVNMMKSIGVAISKHKKIYLSVMILKLQLVIANFVVVVVVVAVIL